LAEINQKYDFWKNTNFPLAKFNHSDIIMYVLIEKRMGNDFPSAFCFSVVAMAVP
jgi:hypothetical protein